MDFRSYIYEFFKKANIQYNNRLFAARAISNIVLAQKNNIPIILNKIILSQPQFITPCYGRYGLIHSLLVDWVVLPPGEYLITGNLNAEPGNWEDKGKIGITYLDTINKSKLRNKVLQEAWLDKWHALHNNVINRTITVTEPAILWVYAGNVIIKKTKALPFTPPVSLKPTTTTSTQRRIAKKPINLVSKPSDTKPNEFYTLTTPSTQKTEKSGTTLTEPTPSTLKIIAPLALVAILLYLLLK